MDVLFTWFDSDLAVLTLPLVILGALFPWKRERDVKNWIVVGAFAGGWLLVWLLYKLFHSATLGFCSLFLTIVLWFSAGRILRFLLSSLKKQP